MTYTTATLVEADIRASAVFSSSTTPTLSQVNTWIDEVDSTIDLITNNVYSSNVETSLYLDYDGGDILILPYSPVSALTLRYNTYDSSYSTQSWVTLEEGLGKNYLLYSNEGEVEFIHGSGATNLLTPKAGRKKFCADITYGESSVPNSIQRLATLYVVKRVIMSVINYQANAELGAIQVGTISVEDPSMFSINYLKYIDSEIKNIKEDINVDFSVFRNSVRYYEW